MVADRLRVTSATVSCWESGRRFPTGKHFDELVKMTKMAPCQFFCIHIARCADCELSSSSRRTV
jgi:transcriptional regulator with XRE-family HTH domain